MAAESRAPRQERSRRRVEQILEAARALIREHGCAGLKIGDIAERAGVTAGSIYQYFDNKSAIISALARDVVEAQRRSVEDAFADELTSLDGLIERTDALLEAYYELYRTDPVVRDIWLGSASDKAIREIDAEDTAHMVALLFDRSKHLFPKKNHAAARRGMLLLIQFADTSMMSAAALDETRGRLVLDDAKSMLVACWESCIEPLAKGGGR
jgi:AcrR family transcriptional regulator